MSTYSFALVIPCYNFSSGLSDSLKKIADWRLSKKLNFLLCISDDGSTDSSYAVAQEFQRKNSQWCVVRQSLKNQGKGAAVREGASIIPASVPYIFFTDSDLHYGLDIIIDRMLPLLESGVEVVMLDRSWNRQFHSSSPIRKMLSYCFIHLKTVLAGVPFEDSQAGMKGFRSEFLQVAFPMVKVKGFAFDVELLSIALLNRFRIVQIPISIKGDGSYEGSSMTLSKAIRMFWDLISVALRRYSGRYENSVFYERIANQVYEIKK